MMSAQLKIWLLLSYHILCFDEYLIINQITIFFNITRMRQAFTIILNHRGWLYMYCDVL